MSLDMCCGLGGPCTIRSRVQGDGQGGGVMSVMSYVQESEQGKVRDWPLYCEVKYIMGNGHMGNPSRHQ